MLSYSDQRDLTAFYQLGHFEKSTLGPMLDRAEMFAVKTGKRAELTARPTAELRVEAKSEPRTEDLELIGRVSARLKRIRPLYRRALELVYGDAGACCAERLKKYGRIVSLFLLTKTGRELAKAEKKQSKGLKLTGLELIQNAVSRNPGSQDVPIISEVHIEARALLKRAEEAYGKASQEIYEERWQAARARQQAARKALNG